MAAKVYGNDGLTGLSLPYIVLEDLTPVLFPRIRRITVMPMTPKEIERLIKERLPDAEVTIEDLAGDGDHYAATVISSAFKGKTRVQQHQIVYEALQGNMGGALHALALQTKTPEAAS